MNNLEPSTMEKVNDNERISQATLNHMIEPSSIKIEDIAITSPIETLIQAKVKKDYPASDSLELELYLFVDGDLLLNKLKPVLEKELRKIIVKEVSTASNRVSVGQVVVASENTVESDLESSFGQLFFYQGD